MFHSKEITTKKYLKGLSRIMRGHDTMTEKREVEKIFFKTSLCRKRRSHGTCLHTLERLPGLEDLERWPRSSVEVPGKNILFQVKGHILTIKATQ